jgi:hypothetical protein
MSSPRAGKGSVTRAQPGLMATRRRPLSRRSGAVQLDEDSPRVSHGTSGVSVPQGRLQRGGAEADDVHLPLSLR